jgi:RNA polymerase sigma-70 factor (ECF subfamily)
MNELSAPTTSLSLFERLHDPADQDAWGEFDRRYGPRIRTWCLRWGLQEVDAEDLRQQLLLKLLDKMQTFVYDPRRSFRGWLKTLVRHAVSDFVKQRSGTVRGSGDSKVWERLNEVEAREDLVGRLKAQFDLDLLEIAGGRVRQRVAPSTWAAFVGTAIEFQSAGEVARRTGLSIDQVYSNKAQVLRLLREEIQRLQG